QLLLPYADKPVPWPELIGRILPWNADEDTRPLFELRLRLLAKGIPARPDYLFTEKLVHREPTWLVELLSRLLSLAGEDNHDRESGTLSREDFSPYWPSQHVAVVLRNIAEAVPAHFWATITPFVVSAVAEHRSEPHHWEHLVF